MEQEFLNNNIQDRIAIVGAGPAGVMCALKAAQNSKNTIYLIDKNPVLGTILPTGGGRCNLAYNEFNPILLAKNYPRGEKFLYSIFSKFSTQETLDFFNDIGIKTYTQDDNRIFPKSNNAKEVRQKMLTEIQKCNIKLIRKNVIDIKKKDNLFEIYYEKGILKVSTVVLATGGNLSSFKLAKELGHKIIPPKASLAPLKIQENYLYKLQGISLKNISAVVVLNKKILHTLEGDLLFTHKSISGPLALKISALCAFEKFDSNNYLELHLNLVNLGKKELEQILKGELENNPKKQIITILSKYLPKYLILTILEKIKIFPERNCAEISKKTFNLIIETLTDFVIHVYDIDEKASMVTAGGVDTNQVNSKTMQSKLVEDLFFCGEILNIDGITGGFNLQNCWSTGSICGEYLTAQTC